MLKLFVVALLCIAETLVDAAAVTWSATPLNPPSVPLAVRSPYLSAWLPQGSGQPLNGVWPTFWTGTVIIILLLLIYSYNHLLVDFGLGRFHTC